MTPERWQQIRAAYEQVVVLNLSERLPQLHKIAVDDPELRQEVESLLIYEDRAESAFLNRPAADLLKPESFTECHPSRVGRRIGVYQIIEEIGHGGMGEVYRAARVDGQYTKEVAVKLVRSGYDTSLILERFRHERQILATLDHPNIARLLDGGTTEEGIPYLVMELIDGLPIDRYCDEHGLGITERLGLFVQVCSAVQYAHQRLVVHRDLKPSNILVTADAAPKLLDFGIAKILDPAAETEVTLVRPMTPEYASPEQIRGEAISTASDVYSLGVVLFRLLTGQSPYCVDPCNPADLVRAVAEAEPDRPSAVVAAKAMSGGPDAPKPLPLGPEAAPTKLRRILKGDLDNIALKALRKEPEQRYSSVEQLASDIGRHLRGLPVTATQGSWSYRADKFAKRHKIAILATAIILVTLLGGIAATFREARIARKQATIASAERARAEKRFNDVRQLANSLLFEIHDSIKDLPGSTPTRKLLVTRALQYLDSLSQEAKGDPSLQRELAAAYQRIGDVQGQPRQANLGDPQGAAASYRKALAIRESLAKSDPGNLDIRRDLVPSYGKLSDLLRTMGDLNGAIDYSRKQFETAQHVYQSDPGNIANRVLFGTYCMDHGYKQATIGGERAAGLENMRQGALVLEKVVADQPQNMYARRILGLSYSRTAELLRAKPSERSQALSFDKKSLAVNLALVSADPNNADYRRLVAYNQFDLAALLADMNDLKGALIKDREALVSFQTLAANDPASTQFQQDIAEVHGHMGELLARALDFSHAIPELKTSLAALDKVPIARNPHLEVGQIELSDQFWLGKAHTGLAFSKQFAVHKKQEHCSEAVTWFRKCLPGFVALRRDRSGYDGPDRVPAIESAIAQCRSEAK